MPQTLIEDVSDTALWVAVYRARETKRPDALFQDPYAGMLSGERGHRIASAMQGSRFAEWSVVTRTRIIDDFIRELVADGVRTIVNLGAGLDTRPYRLDLPSGLRWIEVDFPNMIELKESKLAHETPRCQLERVKLDLSNDALRREFLAKLAKESSRILVLTEGVTPYLTPEQVGALADDLHAQPSFRHWISDYYSTFLMNYLKKRRTRRQMKNAPFRFFPEDWFGFFDAHGWKARESRYLGEASEKFGRKIPIVWWAELLRSIWPVKMKIP